MTITDSKFTDKEIEYIGTFDSEGNPLEGGKNYRMHLPQNIPARNFWSVIVYDSQNRLIIQADQKWPSVFSNCKTLVINRNGSVDIWFGPKAPAGNKGNWIQTLPGNFWNMILHLYDPTETWFDKSWRPGEIVGVEQSE